MIIKGNEDVDAVDQCRIQQPIVENRMFLDA